MEDTMPPRRLTEKDVISILSRPDDSIKDLASYYRISTHSVYEIFANRMWKSIDRSLYPSKKDNRRKLTEEQVFAIRAEDKPNLKELASKYNVSETYISNLRDKNRFDSWKRVPHTSVITKGRKLTVQQVAEIKAMPKVRKDFLAKKYGVCKSHITKIRSGLKWKNVKPASYDLSFSL